MKDNVPESLLALDGQDGFLFDESNLDDFLNTFSSSQAEILDADIDLVSSKDNQMNRFASRLSNDC